MTRKKKIKEEPKEVEPINEIPESHTTLVVPKTWTKIDKVSKEDSGLVTVKVKIGTLSFEQGTYQKNDVFQVTRERAALFDEHDVELLA